jgi:beta-lactamase superfamily II metal-dependent hydrolase
MYNMGFGDSFRVIVRDGPDTWRMLVDCGAHAHGQIRPIDESVKTIIGDLKEECGGGTPHLDVVVATHHHRDHIVGFAEDEWAAVEVGEVWVPFVENKDDDDAAELRRVHANAAKTLEKVIKARRAALGADQVAIDRMLEDAQDFAENSVGNERATLRLLGSTNEITFANKPEVRYLPGKFRGQNTIEAEKCGVIAHILGPPRDPEMIRKMHPPARAGWLTLNLDDDNMPAQDDASWALFSPGYILADDSAVPDTLTAAETELKLSELTNDAGLLAAASLLERATNNTSLFFVLEVGGLRFLFPGDAQHGAWEHVRKNPQALELIKSVDFYKVGHHGSHNATPKEFILSDWAQSRDAMVPWGEVKKWKGIIPKPELMDALAERHHRVILPNEVRKGPGGPHAAKKVVRKTWWTELTFTVPN